MPIKLEVDRYPEFREMLNWYGVAHKNTDGINCPRCFSVVVPASGGVPDYSLTVRGFGTVIEVKAGADRINFNQITPEQREHMNWWQMKSEGTAWLAVFIGTDRVNTASLMRKRLFLVEWDYWQEYEETILEYEKYKYAGIASINGMRIQNEWLTISEACSQYECVWEKGIWHIPFYYHPFAIKYLWSK